MLKIDNLSTSYQTMDGFTHVLNDLNFTIRDDEIFGIAGESGCGKTTLLKTLYDIIEFPLVINEGKIILSGEHEGKDYRYETGTIHDTWWDRISYVPQAAQSVLNPILVVREHFLDSLPKKRTREDERKALKLVGEYLEELGLDRSMLNAYPFQLSGGMRQRMIIALATYMNPDFVLADEPTTALDVVVQRSILQLLMKLQRQQHNTLVVVTHDMGVHYQITDRMGVMYSGSMAEIGDTEKIFDEPKHPYTRMLVDSLPHVGDPSPKEGIPGRPPDLKNPPPGCRFAPRCPHASEMCTSAPPQFAEIEPERYTACYLYPECHHDEASGKAPTWTANAPKQAEEVTYG